MSHLPNVVEGPKNILTSYKYVSAVHPDEPSEDCTGER